MKLSRTTGGVVLALDEARFLLDEPWDALVNHEDLAGHLRGIAAGGARSAPPASRLLPPLGTQEVWGAGVTYARSRTARMEESHEAGGGDFYDRVYSAERPELFFKAAPWRVRGPGEAVRIRRDARWSVPEPELALCVNARGTIVGYTIGNDLSARDIEGENPLYLSQAKIYDGACALGPVLLVREQPLGPDTVIALAVARNDTVAFAGETTLERLRRTPEDLVRFLYREASFPSGCVLLTGRASCRQTTSRCRWATWSRSPSRRSVRW
jgi:2-dehydro-3-deoxy-D-arabinonate dehydratase